MIIQIIQKYKKTLERVHTIKYLGILLDQHSKWNKHIDYLCSKLKYLIYIFYKINKIKNIDIIRKIYFAYAHSLFQYINEVWGAAYDTHLKKLFILQKHIIRAALGRPRLYPSRDIFLEFKVPTIRQNYMKNIILHINKNKSNIPAHITPHNTRPNNRFNTELIKLTICRHQFTYYCSYIINKIPNNFIDKQITRNLSKSIDYWIEHNIFFKLVVLSIILYPTSIVTENIEQWFFHFHVLEPGIVNVPTLSYRIFFIVLFYVYPV